MNIEELVPSLELCKKIPAGELKGSVFVWRMPNSYYPPKDEFHNIFVRDMCGAKLKNNQIPAPTVAEILKVLWDNYQKPTVYFRNNWYATVVNDYGDESAAVDNENAANAALKLWLKLKGVE